MRATAIRIGPFARMAGSYISKLVEDRGVKPRSSPCKSDVFSGRPIPLGWHGRSCTYIFSGNNRVFCY